jgi:geranylgeranyl pyrophosphate synthase
MNRFALWPRACIFKKMMTTTLPDTQLHLDKHLSDVRQLMVRTLEETSLRGILKDSPSLTALGGKMLRSRLAFRVGHSTGADPELLVYGSAAVEMIHTASLLHDDVIDGGMIRRGVPTFWVEKGKAGAILLGDLLLFKAVDLMCRVANGAYTHDLVKLTGEVCEAESEQELIFQGSESRLELCQSIARRKTGALFAFAALIGGQGNAHRTEVLKESGYLLGTVYQLADDILDTRDEEGNSGKTLGTDAARDIVSAARLDDVNLEGHLDALLEASVKILNGDTLAAEGVKAFIAEDLQPALRALLG